MEKSFQKVIVFIDGNNFYYKLKDIVSNASGIIKLLDFNYIDFTRNLIKENTLVEIRYYVGAIKRQAGGNSEKSEKLYANQQKLIAKLQQQKVTVILGNLIQHPDKSFHEKGVDVRIAVEMIRYARENTYDVAYLLSSDTDLVPAVEEVRSFHKQVIYVGVSNGQSFGLTKASNNTILLREEDIVPYIPIIYEMKLGKLSFEKIKDGSKTIEVRLFDEKRSLLRVGDEIEFSLAKNQDQKIKTKVVELLKYKTFSELFDVFPAEFFGSSSKEDLMHNIYIHYTKEDEVKYGVLGIRLKYIT